MPITHNRIIVAPLIFTLSGNLQSPESKGEDDTYLLIETYFRRIACQSYRGQINVNGPPVRLLPAILSIVSQHSWLNMKKMPERNPCKWGTPTLHSIVLRVLSLPLCAFLLAHNDPVDAQIRIAASPISIEASSLSISDERGAVVRTDSDNIPKFRPPPPFGPMEFWGKIVDVISANHGYLKHEQFEKAFDIKLRKAVDNAEATNYGLLAGDEWYFNVALYEYKLGYRDVTHPLAPGGIFTALDMEWPIDTFGNWMAGNCVVAAEATKMLLDSGWKYNVKKSWAHTADAMADYLVLGNSVLRIHHYLHYLGPFGKDDGMTCVDKFYIKAIP
ncbi:hypothetical protein [Cupriavidus basilensis]|uniref:hypothetical protein n=1 Tax=Cupriavidus basilensis TaxID=68895 RepID=UPI00118708FC|nr:hypothetical protein [Cupriavidus basilensis]